MARDWCLLHVILASFQKGGSANPSCRISASLGPQESANGSVKLVVTNAHYSSKSSEASANISYQNTTANDPFATVRAGCWIDTPRFDTIRSNRCMELIYKDSTIAFSVGEKRVILVKDICFLI